VTRPSTGDPEDKLRYVAPDLAVVDGPPPDPLPRVYLKWEDPPLLFVAEVISDATAARERSEKPFIYENALCVPEYLVADPEDRGLIFWRLQDGRYRSVRPQSGRMVSETLNLAFGFDDSGFLRIYTPDGEMLLTHAEERARAELEADRARVEAERADAAMRRAQELEVELKRLRGG
jgi:Uma2 family endonuclease